MNNNETQATALEQAPRYAGDGAEVGKWFASHSRATMFHLIGKRIPDVHDPRWTRTVSACGTRFFPGFEFSARWAALGGRKCPKCEAKA